MNHQKPTPRLSSPTNIPKIKDLQKSKKENKTTEIQKQNRKKLRHRSPDVGSRSVNGKDNKISQNAMLKSPLPRNSSTRNSLKPKSESTQSSVYCDVTFLRKLRVLNKQQELLLNKELAKILREEESRRGFNKEHSPDRCELLDTEEELESSASSVNSGPNKHKRLSNSGDKQICKSGQRNLQYDLNGRRVYNFSDDEEEEEYDSVNYEEEMREIWSKPNYRSKTWINTTTMIKTKSDVSFDLNGRCKASAERKSLICINLPDKKFRDHKYLKGKSEIQPLHSGRRIDHRGDGIQNVVVHCCEVAKEKKCPEKRIAKVWNFDNIPKVKSSENGNKIFGSNFIDFDKMVKQKKYCQVASQVAKSKALRSMTIC